MAAFEEMGVQPEISKALDEMEWMLPTGIQSEAIPLILGGGDVLMAAETGTGKTGAFCIPVLQIIWETLKEFEPKNLASSKISTCWSLSEFDKNFGITITDLHCQNQEQKQWLGCRANKGIQGNGKYYFETVVSGQGLCRVGWSTDQANLDLGTDSFGWGYGGTGKKSHAKIFDNYGEAFSKNDVIGCLLDLNIGEIRYSKNGIDLGPAFSLDSQQKSNIFFPAVVLKNSEMLFNFGVETFKYPPLSGYVAVSKAPKDHIIVNPIDNKQLKISKFAPQAIIIEPSRELAEQTYNQLQKFKKYMKNPEIKELLLVGGQNIKEQITVLNDGVNIVVATPGRLKGLIEERRLLLNQCRCFILDEADALLKQNHTSLINQIHQQIPKITIDGKGLQMVVCSATLHDFEVKKMAERLMRFPTWVDLKGEDVVPETVHHVVVMVDPKKDDLWQKLRRHIRTDGVHNKDDIRAGNTAEALSEAVKILKAEYCLRAIREHKMDRALIFCRTKLDCDNLEHYLTQVGDRELTCVCLHGDRNQNERKENLMKFKENKVRFLICTDVAARGLDITGLPFMISVTLSDDNSNYIHRVGRVGRVDKMGLAISLVSRVPEKVWYHGKTCSSKGRNCSETNLIEQGGCCIWYNEERLLADIEDRLNITIQQIENDMKVPTNDFDGKVIYGEKKIVKASNYKDHVQEMAPIVADLAALESQAQLIYLRRYQTFQ